MNSILIVDDEKDNLEALQRLLRNQYQVSVTKSAFEALKLVQKNEFSVIISDQRMPEMTGVELLEKVKHVASSTTRILLTGYTDIESVIDAINRGNIYRYIAKPWDPEDLRLTVRQADEAFALRKELDEKNKALTASNTELNKAVEALRVLDRAKAKFLSLISHELNTPLTVLSSYAGLLVEKKNTFAADLQKAVGAVSDTANRFTQIVSEVLTYVKLESEADFKKNDLDLVALVKAVAADLSAEASKKQLKFEFKSAGDLRVSADGDKLRVALRKLLSDAILHAPTAGQLRMVCESKSGVAQVSLWRDGQLLSADAFSPLVSQGSEMHHQKDLGLSLAIFKLVIEGHGGDVDADSSKTKGTTIRFSLPLAGAH